MSSLGLLSKAEPGKYRSLVQKQDCLKGYATLSSDSLRREMLSASEFSKSLETEYIRSLHRQIYLFELENKYLRKEVGKIKVNVSNPNKGNEDKIKLLNVCVETANAQMTDGQRSELINELVRKCDEIQEKLNREIELRKEQMDIFTQDILELKGEKETILGENQKKDQIIGELKGIIDTLKDRLVEVGGKFETCKQALTVEIKRRKGLESKIEKKSGNFLKSEETMLSVDNQIQKKNESQHLLANGETTLSPVGNRMDLCNSICELSKRVTSQEEELKELKKVIYKSEEQRPPTPSFPEIQLRLTDDLRWKAAAGAKEDFQSGTSIVRRRWRDVEESKTFEESSVHEDPIQPTEKKALPLRLYNDKSLTFSTRNVVVDAKQSKEMNKCMCTSVILLLVGIALHIALPFVIHGEISRRMKLFKGSTLFDSWSTCRSGIVVEFYFFTVTNEKDFMHGSKPIVNEVGPYTYEQSTCKDALDAFPQNGSVRYSDKNSFKFLPERSVGLESDELTVLNVGYIAIANRIGESRILDEVAKMIFKLFYHSQLFLNKTVSEMIWGYEDPALKFISKFITVETIIGLYPGKNDSAGPTFEVEDGVQNTTKVGQILTFNGHREMSVWNTSLANHIAGSDGSLFPPFLESTVHVFSADLCRSLQFHTAKKPETVYINSVPTTKFSLSKETFLSPEECPDNRGFCLDYPNCPKSGTLDMRTCMKGAPIAISLPHFNGADESYRNAVIGMHPRDDMDISLYIEPQTGVILQALQLIQINAIVQSNPHLSELAHLKNVTYLPIAYINTSIYVSESVVRTLMSTLIVPQMSIRVAASLVVISALVSLVVNGGMLIYRHCHPSQISDGTQENAPLIVQCPSDSPSFDDPQVSIAESSPTSERSQTSQAAEGGVKSV
uniref:Lysosome membrane protein 2 n=1 Tax=Echinococcus granulosus TaxID=6210 RepID=A0A068WBD1_ECHGR|nr:lysosome membrane protein 2 [Echinococcus granulosus]